jgi:Fic family protein
VADWDANSPKLQRNLQALGPQVTADARARQPLTSEAIRQWHAHVMRELTAPQGEPIGTFRGERGLADYDVRVGGYLGVSAREVAGALHAFDKVLQQQIGHLDALISPKRLTEDITNDRLNAILILCAWAHGEWVRIHPFPNGNGRSARILVNSIAQRYGLPAFMRVRPRPGDKYEWIAQQAMQGNWKAAIPFFARLYEAAL